MTRLPFVGAALLAALAVVAGVTRPAAAPSSAAATAASRATAVRATLFCPDLRTVEGTLSTGITVGTTTPGDGTVTLSAATSAVGATALLGAGEQVSPPYTGPLTGPLVVRAQGALSSGLVGDQLARANKTEDRGWAEARCEPPRSDEWFIGAGTTAGDTPEAVLANPGDTRAIVTVTVLTPNGLVASSAGGNLVLAPHSLQRVPLTSLAPGAAVTAVHVQTEVGEVSAAIRDTRVSGTTLLGTDWVPLNEPADAVVVPGLPGVVAGAAPARTLFVADTGTDDTAVEVRVTTADGTFVPSGLAAKVVPAQSVVAIDLSAVLGSEPASIRVTSGSSATGTAEPIVAGALVDAASTLGNGIHEITFAGAASAVAGPALVPVITLGPGVEDDLILSAPGARDGALDLSVSTGAGSPPRVTAIPIAAGTTRAVDLATLGAVDGGVAVVVPQPGSGPVYATRLIQEAGALGPLVSELSLTGAPTAFTVPATAALPIASGP